MKKSLSRCPVCGNELKVAEYRCDSCGTTIKGRFDMCEFCGLSEEDMKFLKSFILTYGNISLVAREYGISHPTAKLRLKAIINRLGWSEENYGRVSEIEVLEMVEKGKVTIEEAIRIIKEVKNEQRGDKKGT